MKKMPVKTKNFYFGISKYKIMFFIFLGLMVVYNLTKNFSLCNFRSRSDMTQIFSFFRNELTPNTTLMLHMYSEAADGLFYYLNYTRRDIGMLRHNNNLNSELLAKHSDLSLPAFMGLLDRSEDRHMFYVTDKDIDRNFFLLPIPSQYPLRFIMGDIFNLQLYQGFESRQLYYALSKELEGGDNPVEMKISASIFEKYKALFLNNWEVSQDKSFIRPKYIGLVSNIAIFKPEDSRVKEVWVNFSLALNPTRASSVIKNAVLSFYLNNVVIKNVILQSGEGIEVTLKIPASSLCRPVNFLAIIPFYNSVNCFYPSQLYPAPQGSLAKGDYPYLIKSIYIEER